MGFTMSVSTILVLVFAISVTNSMRDGTRSYQEKLNFVAEIEGTINGERFRIEGNGQGNARTGYVKGKFVSVDGELPVQWEALTGVLGLGLECFAKYPDEIYDVLKGALPEGYSMDRKIYFENDGIMKSYHTVTLDGRTIRTRTRVIGQGFRRSGNVLRRKLQTILPAVMYVAPEGEGKTGVRSAAYGVFPLKGSDSFQIARGETTYRSNRRDGYATRLPPYHHIRGEVRQYKKAGDRDNHIIQEGILEAYELKLLTNESDLNCKGDV